jgi:hypothetical protein
MGNKPNPYIAKQKEKQQQCFEAGCDITAQQFFDYLCIVLNDPNVMGKDVFGENRIKKVHEALKEVDRHYSEAFVNSQESDYYQSKLDAELIQIFGEIDPFEKRYPYIKTWNYNKPCRK